jgi:polysaccharide biosynthesis/export protein
MTSRLEKIDVNCCQNEPQSARHPNGPTVGRKSIRRAAQWLAAFAGGVLATAALAQQPAPQSTPDQPAAPAKAPVVAPAPPSSPLAAEGAGTTSQYVIGPGDIIQVFVWRNPELSVTVPVRPDGKISSPLVEDLVAVGKTPALLARDIETVLAEYVKSPQVNIIVTNAASSFSQVKVIGQVKSPQSVAYKEGMTVLDLVLSVGGMTEFAAGNRARLLRKDEKGKSMELKVRLNDLVERGKLGENIAVQPGDVLIVPEAFF